MKLFTPRRRRWVARLGLAGTSTAIGLVATGAVLSPASADAPVKVGWWNLASGGGQAVPAPDTNAGGIRVAVATTEWLSYGAVQYSLPRDGAATLELKVTQISGNSNAPQLNQIVACPTKDNNWKAGDDQDSSGAPGYTCDVRKFVGHLSADLTTMTFLVDGSADVSDGVLSLAIVPEHTTEIPEAGTDPGTGTDLTPPFVVDFDAPTSNAFTPEDNGSSDFGSGSTDTSTTPPTTTGSTGAGATGAPSGASGPVSVPPMTTTDAGNGQSPVVASQQPTGTGTGTGNGVTPAAAVGPAKSDNSKHDLLLVLLVLILFGILYTQNGTPRMPLTAAMPRAGGGDGATPPIPYPAGSGTPRGLGRFNKPRGGGARPLI
jgi:hypothetical protein